MSHLKIGTVCIWQNQVAELAYLNGTECTITGPLTVRTGVDQFGNKSIYAGYPVDTIVPFFDGIYAEIKDLKPKEPPADEKTMEEYNALIERVKDGCFV